MSSSEETVWVLRVADQATRPLAAVREMWTSVAAAANATAHAMRGATAPIESVRGEVSKATAATEAAAMASRTLRQRLDELAAGGKLGGFLQDLALGRSATASLRDALGLVRREEQALDRDTKSLGDRFRDLGNWIRAGLGIDIGMTIGRTIRGWIDDLVHAIPDAVAAGRAYAQMIDDLVDQTGMLPQQASQLVGIFGRIGLTTGEIDRTFAMFGRNLVENEDLFKRLGIATRDSNGDLLDAYTIITNTRRAFAEHGAQLQSTGAAQELFSRSGYKLLDFLSLSDAQVKVYTDDLARMGLILDSATTTGAERFGRELNRVGQVVAGLQTTVFAALGPSLERFVDAFADFVRDNLNEIVSFVVNVANFVMGVIGGLLGLDFATRTTEQSVAAAGSAAGASTSGWKGLEEQQRASTRAADVLSTSLERQIKAIDREIEAIRRRAEARHAANQREQLALELAKAQQQLEDLRGNRPYLEGLTNAQQQLALQKHAQDIADARKAVAGARQGLAGFDADQSDQAQIAALERRRARFADELAAHKRKVQEQAALELGLKGQTVAIDDALVAKSDSMFASITAAAQAWRDRGTEFARELRTAFGGLLDIILGPEQALYGGGGAGAALTSRSGGLVGALGGVTGVMDLVKVAAFGLAGVLGINLLSSIVGLLGPLAGAAGATVRLAGPLAGVAGTLASLVGISGAAGAALFGLGLLIADWIKGMTGMSEEEWQAAVADRYWRMGGGQGKPPGYASGGWAGLHGEEIIRVGDGGEPELVIPKSRLERGGDGLRREIINHIHLHLEGRQIAEVVDRIFDDDAGNAPVPLGAAGVA